MPSPIFGRGTPAHATRVEAALTRAALNHPGDTMTHPAKPWGTADPVQWAADTGRITAADVPNWRAQHTANAAQTEHWLAQLTPVPALGDVQAVAGGRRPIAAATPTTATAGAYAVNPLVDEALSRYQSLRSAPNRPTLFATGDVPLTTASGVDPAILTRLPWRIRHAVAATPSRAEAYELCEVYGGDDHDAGAIDAAVDNHPGNRAYRARVEQWIAVHLSDDELYAVHYGPEALASMKAQEAAEREALRQHLQQQRQRLDEQLNQL